MPYIKDLNIRAMLANGETRPIDAGELNFAITHLCATYIDQKGKRYVNINEVIGALECAKLELYRRVAAPYEDEKIVENGDVYPHTILPEVN